MKIVRINKMITWITTVGWSPFAVINPIWAYCKENVEYPDKIIIIHTPHEQIKNNLHICKRIITEILKSYNGKNFKEDSIIEEEIENDNIELYAVKLSKIIGREKTLKPNKIILDMTPGRKYMSAINVYYGYNLDEIPIQVFYLHLDENKYQDVPYPLCPIIKNELIDILESTEIFSKDLEKPSEKEGKKGVEVELGNDALDTIEDDDKKKEYLTLLSIKKSFNTKTKIRKFTFGYGTVIRGHELDKILKGLITRGYVMANSIVNNNQKYIIYDLTKQGEDFIEEVKQQNNNENQEAN